MGNTFNGGIHIESHKILSRERPIIEMPAPRQVVIPLSQHTGRQADPTVKKGDTVKVGTKIGQSSHFISAAVHASVAGTVRDVAEQPHPVLGQGLAVIIDNDGSDAMDEHVRPRQAVDRLAKDEILTIVTDAGIVGMGGAAFPAHVKFAPPKPVDTLLINGAECEPYLTCDFRLMCERPSEILRGILLLQKVLGVSATLIGVEDDKPEALASLRNKIAEMKLSIQVVSLPAKYPQGAEKQLIKALVDREVPPGKLPFEVGCVVGNVSTALAVYEAVYLGRPLYRRVVTVTGAGATAPANLLVRIGTTFADVLAFSKGLKGVAGKLIMGGPMMGIAQATDRVPVIKGTSGILVLTPDQVRECASEPCIRCGRCVEHCPVGMVPSALSICGESRRYDLSRGYNPFDCIECGICTYVCPAQRRILEYIKLIKVVTR